METEKLKELINENEPTFLERAKKKGYVCPDCNNGTGETGDGIVKDERNGTHYKCFKCGLYEDTVGLYGHTMGIDNYIEQLVGAASYFGIDTDIEIPDNKPREKPRKEEKKTEKKTEPITEADYTEFFKECNKHLPESDYMQKRGISKEICDKYLIGFCSDWKPPKNTKAPASPRIIIPTSKSSYFARDTRTDLSDKEEDYSKSNAGNIHIFGIKNAWESAKKNGKPIFIAEGAIDALSIIEAGGEAVGLGGISNIDILIDEIKKNPPAQPFIVSLDNDIPGQNAQQKLIEKLSEISAENYGLNISGNCKDENEALTTNREKFIEEVNNASDIEYLRELKRKEQREKYLTNCASSHIEEFIDGIADSVNTECIPTGFPILDSVLDGGLYEGLYIIGAISSLGKTTLIMQIADNIAMTKKDVLIFSLEMARTELMAKSISRLTAQLSLDKGKSLEHAKTARGITSGKKWENYSQDECKLIFEAIDEYRKYADHLFISEGIGDIGASEIRETIEKHISITGAVPVVIVDYLQILAPYNERYSDKQNTDKAVLELKRISRDYKTPVLIISSFNRSSYKNEVNMEAFKESGAIEYSADVLLGLQFERDSGLSEQEAKSKDRRNIELVVLKNRNGRTGKKLAFDYYALFNLFKNDRIKETET